MLHQIILDDIMCIPICDLVGHTAAKYMRPIVYDAYTHGLITTNLKDKLMTVESDIPKIQLLTGEQLSAFPITVQKHDACYFEILLALFAELWTGEIRGLNIVTLIKKSLKMLKSEV